MTQAPGFALSRTARSRFGVDGATDRGHLRVLDRAGVRRLASRMNETREPGTPPAQPGEIVALGLLHEIFHLLVERYEEEANGSLDGAATDLERQLREGARKVLRGFENEFPTDGKPEPPPEVVEELLLTRVANENPAAIHIRDLFDDRPIAAATPYEQAIAALEASLADGPPFGPDGETLFELLRAPARHAPGSLAGQLRYIRERWRGVLGDALERLMGEIDLTLGVLAEEERALQLRDVRWGVGAGSAHAPSFAGAENEPERFSHDSDWMPRVVLMAKSTYVWLDQLSRWHGRDIRTLDAIPDAALDQLARWGVTGLWLIGLWERSTASEKIKRWRGNEDAVASAYSLDDYRIADDLGGEAAYATLRDRAWARGIRLASDMVPNHMGIDSRWVVEHPDWFLSLTEPPYPAYTYTGADLSDDPRVGVVLEDHYWNDSDAAVTFKRFDKQTGDARYVYHGNDGTSFPWNDTAQLDFLKPEVREAVIQTIIAVARRFPVIRFDAAMVLAKKHIERLWWPEPGSGGGIPSRAEFGSLPKAEFDRRMPAEFWREVVDRVATEVPDTLLLAEAFWLLEGYFVRTLGMHRVYNSAFMHMLRDEDNAGYRRVIKETLEFDPEILKRYVNFMSNPDEQTAVEQFGKGDKYFGVAVLLATLPGLPMLGHGQIEGFGEKYGMEFRRATLDERVDEWLVERHQREIFPLLHRRGQFAEAQDFLLYDFLADGGGVDENVYAYSNGSGAGRSLVVYHNRFGSTSGWIRDSAAYALKSDDGSKRLVRRSLGEGLGLPSTSAAFMAFRDARTGLEHLRPVAELRQRGLHVSLDAYQGHVFWEFRELHDGASHQWSRLNAMLGGRGVPSLEDALWELQLEPVHTPLRTAIADPSLASVERVVAAIAEATTTTGDQAAVVALISERAKRTHDAVAAIEDPVDEAALRLWTLLSSLGSLPKGADAAATSRAWYDELRMAPVVATGLRERGLDEASAWATADLVRVLLDLPRPGTLRGPARTVDARLLEAWLGRDDLRAAIGVNSWEGTEWLDRDRFEAMLRWAARLDAVDAGKAPSKRPPAWLKRLTEAAAEAGYRVDRLRELLAPTPGPKSATKPTPRPAARPRTPRPKAQPR
jgi:glycosidase